MADETVPDETVRDVLLRLGATPVQLERITAGAHALIETYLTVREAVDLAQAGLELIELRAEGRDVN